MVLWVARVAQEEWRKSERKEKYSQLCCRHKLSFHGWKLVLLLHVVVVVVVVDFAFIQFRTSPRRRRRRCF